jgi:hypothetical protein
MPNGTATATSGPGSPGTSTPDRSYRSVRCGSQRTASTLLLVPSTRAHVGAMVLGTFSRPIRWSGCLALRASHAAPSPPVENRPSEALDLNWNQGGQASSGRKHLFGRNASSHLVCHKAEAPHGFRIGPNPALWLTGGPPPIEGVRAGVRLTTFHAPALLLRALCEPNKDRKKRSRPGRFSSRRGSANAPASDRQGPIRPNSAHFRGSFGSDGWSRR